MASSTAIQNLSPRWLTIEPMYSKWADSVGAQIDSIASKYNEAERQGIISKCSLDALELHGQFLGFPKLTTESFQQYRQRLLDLLSLQDVSGTDQAIIDTCDLFGLDVVVVRSRLNPNLPYYSLNNVKKVDFGNFDYDFTQVPGLYVENSTDGYIGSKYRWNRCWIISLTNPWTGENKSMSSFKTAYPTMDAYLLQQKVAGLNLMQANVNTLISTLNKTISSHVNAEMLIVGDTVSTMMGQGLFTGQFYHPSYDSTVYRFSLKGGC